MILHDGAPGDEATLARLEALKNDNVGLETVEVNDDDEASLDDDDDNFFMELLLTLSGCASARVVARIYTMILDV
ncbi:hypothetical protein ACFX13_003670 [Malus domestica]